MALIATWRPGLTLRRDATPFGRESRDISFQSAARSRRDDDELGRRSFINAAALPTFLLISWWRATLGRLFRTAPRAAEPKRNRGTQISPILSDVASYLKGAFGTEGRHYRVKDLWGVMGLWQQIEELRPIVSVLPDLAHDSFLTFQYRGLQRGSVSHPPSLKILVTLRGPDGETLNQPVGVQNKAGQIPNYLEIFVTEKNLNEMRKALSPLVIEGGIPSSMLPKQARQRLVELSGSFVGGIRIEGPENIQKVSSLLYNAGPLKLHALANTVRQIETGYDSIIVNFFPSGSEGRDITVEVSSGDLSRSTTEQVIVPASEVPLLVEPFEEIVRTFRPPVRPAPMDEEKPKRVEVPPVRLREGNIRERLEQNPCVVAGGAFEGLLGPRILFSKLGAEMVSAQFEIDPLALETSLDGKPPLRKTLESLGLQLEIAEQNGTPTVTAEEKVPVRVDFSADLLPNFLNVWRRTFPENMGMATMRGDQTVHVPSGALGGLRRGAGAAVTQSLRLGVEMLERAGLRRRNPSDGENETPRKGRAPTRSRPFRRSSRRGHQTLYSVAAVPFDAALWRGVWQTTMPLRENMSRVWQSEHGMLFRRMTPGHGALPILMMQGALLDALGLQSNPNTSMPIRIALGAARTGLDYTTLHYGGLISNHFFYRATKGRWGAPFGARPRATFMIGARGFFGALARFSFLHYAIKKSTGLGEGSSLIATMGASQMIDHFHQYSLIRFRAGNLSSIGLRVFQVAGRTNRLLTFVSAAWFLGSALWTPLKQRIGTPFLRRS